MSIRKLHFSIPILIGALCLVTAILLYQPATPASAQCGSQASSCKNCHETQAQDPVNNDGTGWHQSHAFGDFCAMCHAGNSQATDKAAAHTGMVDPLSDVKAACSSCHPNDLMDRAKVYADKLGVTIGTGGATTTGGAATPAPTNAPAAVATAPAPAMQVSAPAVIDYSQRYDQTVLGKVSINWGNVILAVLIVVVLLGGGGFVFWNERRLRGKPLSFDFFKPAPKPPLEAPVVDGYSSEVTALLPMLAQLNPVGLHALKRILHNPEEANDLLHSLSHLDPELLKRIRSLDKDSRELLLALAGD